jgi:hypothetical protein
VSGPFIIKGMTVGVADGLRLSVGPDGAVQLSNLTLHVRYDVCPMWAHLALQHLEEAKSKKAVRMAAWTDGTEDQKAATLEGEFEASLQAMVASAIAVDAFHACVKLHVQLPPSTLKKWREPKRGTPRYSQVTEVLRRAFQLKPEAVAGLRKNLKEIYRLRDTAVHPPGDLAAPALHPELGVPVESKFALFRADNAEIVVYAATWIIWNLANGKAKDPQIQSYADGLSQRLSEVFPTGHPYEGTGGPTQ